MAGRNEASAGSTEDDRAIHLGVFLDATWPVLTQRRLSLESGPPLMLIDDLRIEGSHALIRNVVRKGLS